MSNPESPGPNDFLRHGQVVPDPEPAQLLPKTSIDHLLSEEEQRKAEEERREFEAVGGMIYMREEFLYPAVYKVTRERLVSGESREKIRAEMATLEDMPGWPIVTAVRQAYEDALEGRPPRLTSIF